VALRGCKFPKIRVGSVADADTAVREDGVNMIKFRSSTWCPDDSRDRESCYDPTRTALTHLYLSHEQQRRELGELREADIELNGVMFKWTSDKSDASRLNLISIVAHEMGHALGLDHACTQVGDALVPGFARSLAPECRPSRPIQSVMYPTPFGIWVDPAESEAAALCDTYAHLPLEVH